MKITNANPASGPDKRPGGPPVKKTNKDTDEAKHEGPDAEQNPPQRKPEEIHHRAVTNTDEQNKITNSDSDALEEKEQEGV
jgi:hypothetical protein